MALDNPHHLRRRSLAGLAIAGLVGTTAYVVSGSPAAIGAPALSAPILAVAAAPTTLPVYAVRSTGLTTAQSAALGKALGIKGIERSGDGSVRYVAGDKFLAVPTKAGARGKDEDGNPTTATVLDTAAIKKLKPYNAKKALDKVKRALAAAKFAPAGGTAKTGNTTLETVDARGRKVLSAKIDTTVSYGFTLGDLPLDGPGAKIRVAFDAKGAVTGLTLTTRTLVKTGSVKVIDSAGILRRCSEATAGKVKLTSAKPLYWAPALTQKLTTIEPSFTCSGVDGSGAAAQVVVIPAAVDAVLPPMPAPAANVRGQVVPQARAYGRADVGSEGTGPCSGLPNTGKNLKSFNDTFKAKGIPVEFSWLDQNAWEQDFKDPAFGGDDQDWTDHVDMAYWQGHGSPTGFSFSGCSTNDDTKLANTDARWGNGDVEWMSLFTCLILEGTSGGKTWWQRWGSAFHGLHQINSFHTISYHSSDHGVQYATYLLRSNPLRVRSAWAQTSIDDQPDDVVWASMGAIGSGGSVNLNDYFWGKGSVGPDISVGEKTGYWYLRGGS
jgi:hypothetical protein